MNRIGARFAASLLLASLLIGCGRGPAAQRSDDDETNMTMQRHQSAPPGEDPTLAAADGLPCTEECSGQDAGYEWAEQNGIGDPNDCGGDSDSFIEGCMAYAAERTQHQDMQDD